MESHPPTPTLPVPPPMWTEIETGFSMGAWGNSGTVDSSVCSRCSWDKFASLTELGTSIACSDYNWQIGAVQILRNAFLANFDPPPPSQAVTPDWPPPPRNVTLTPTVKVNIGQLVFMPNRHVWVTAMLLRRCCTTGLNRKSIRRV